MKINFDKILMEWAYRVDDGKPNPKKSSHLYHLNEILVEMRWPFEVIDELPKNRIPIKTKLITPNQLNQIYDMMKKEMKNFHRKLD